MHEENDDLKWLVVPGGFDLFHRGHLVGCARAYTERVVPTGWSTLPVTWSSSSTTVTSVSVTTSSTSAGNLWAEPIEVQTIKATVFCAGSRKFPTMRDAQEWGIETYRLSKIENALDGLGQYGGTPL